VQQGRPHPQQQRFRFHLTKGKLNAVRAAFKAGVKPSAIARQFGISQSLVREALATEGRDRKAGR
jgi:transposase-like protein